MNKKTFYLLLFIVITLLLITPKVFYVKNIECFTQFGTCSESFYTVLSQFRNYPLLQPLPKGKAKRLLSKFSEIKEVSLYRRLPSTLVASIELRTPIAGIMPPVLGASISTVDNEGKVLAQVSNTALPILIVDSWNNQSTSLSREASQALKILPMVSSILGKRLTARLSGSTLVTKADSIPEIWIDVTRNTNDWYSPLQRIFSRSTISSKMPVKIDIRFKDPVITY